MKIQKGSGLAMALWLAICATMPGDRKDEREKKYQECVEALEKIIYPNDETLPPPASVA